MLLTAVARDRRVHVMMYHMLFARHHVSSLKKITLMPTIYTTFLSAYFVKLAW
jgi:hypothetical protein